MMWEMKLIFCRWVYTLSIKVFYKVLLSLLMGMIKYSQSTQSNKLAIFLQYLTNEVSHKAFLQKIGKENFTRIMKYFSAVTAFVFCCDAKIQIFNEVPVMLVVICFYLSFIMFQLLLSLVVSHGFSTSLHSVKVYYQFCSIQVSFIHYKHIWYLNTYILKYLF